MLWLRYKRPEMPRPIRLPIGIPIFFLLVTVYLVIAPAFEKPSETLMGVIVVLSGVPVYLIGVAWTSKPKSFLRAYSEFRVLPCFNIMSVATSNIFFHIFS